VSVLTESELQASQQYIEAMERLFQNPDMKVLLDDLEAMKAAIAGSWLTLKPDQLAFEQGRYEGITQTTNHLGMVRELVTQALSNDAAEAAIELYSDHV
jgi:hypothetical protein